MIELATKLWGHVPPVGRMTSPALAAILGFLLGGIGLAIYFRTVVDFLVPVAIAIACILLFESAGGLGWFLGAMIACAYGYFRSAESNLRRQ